MRYQHFYIFLGLLWWHTQAQAQIAPNLTGQELFDEVVDQFKPNFVETYSVARTLMYKEIYNENDSVYTIYTNHALYLPPDEERPIQYLAQDASANGINAEHIYPRSKGASEENGNAFSDMHNLAPAKWSVNSARSNFPFKEVNDALVEELYYRNQIATSFDDIPEANWDMYTEVDNLRSSSGIFEPRESVKGDIARSVFYFYTMYRQEAISADNDFFEDMVNNLCDWHNNDPVDDLEMDRNLMKAIVQDGKTNPFIMDCSLVNRMYCPNYVGTSCEDFTTAVDNTLFEGQEIEPAIKIYPNPNNGIFTLDISNISPGKYQLDIFAMSGQLIYSLQEDLDYFNSVNMWNAKSGQHIIHLINMDTGRKYSGLFEVIK